jgi:hypothetical protein
VPLAFVMNLSGQTTTLGLALASAGGFFPFLSPVIGWFGVALTGSDTSSNSLFASSDCRRTNGASARTEGGSQLVRGRDGQDAVPAEPRGGLGGRGNRRRGKHPVPQAHRLEPRLVGAYHRVDRVAEHGDSRMDGAGLTAADPRPERATAGESYDPPAEALLKIITCRGAPQDNQRGAEVDSAREWS